MARLAAPHLTVAIFATTMYWTTDPVLVVAAWIFALGGTTAEGHVGSAIKTRAQEA